MQAVGAGMSDDGQNSNEDADQMANDSGEASGIDHEVDASALTLVRIVLK